MKKAKKEESVIEIIAKQLLKKRFKKPVKKPTKKRRKKTKFKKGFYKGVLCDSSWELAYLLFCEDFGIVVKRNTQLFPYTYRNRKHYYLPDYVVIENEEYIEIKGMETMKWKAKLEQFPFRLTVLSTEKMKPILDYVIKKHGKDFVRLYDKH